MMTGSENRGEKQQDAAPDWTWSRCDREVRCTMHIPGPDYYGGTCRCTLQYDGSCRQPLPLFFPLVFDRRDIGAFAIVAQICYGTCVASHGHYPIPRASLSHTQCSRDRFHSLRCSVQKPVPGNGKVLLFMVAFHPLVQWFVQNPLAAATLLYAAAVCGVLVYAFFEPRDQT